MSRYEDTTTAHGVYRRLGQVNVMLIVTSLRGLCGLTAECYSSHVQAALL